MITRAIFLIFCILAFPGLAQAREGLNFKVPAPPESKMLENTQGEKKIGDKVLRGADYQSAKEQAAIIEYYQGFFEEEDFKQIQDNYLHEGAGVRRLRFKKEDLVVDLILMPNAQGTSVGIVKYLQPQGSPDLEKTLPAVSDLISLPQTDSEGEDLATIPRPPKSVRVQSFGLGKTIQLIYTSSLPIEEVKEFYLDQMPYAGWQIKRDAPVSQAAEAYKSKTGKNTLVPPIFSDGENLGNVAAGAALLDFENQGEKARITIFSNFMGKESGSMVHIEYTKPD